MSRHFIGITSNLYRVKAKRIISSTLKCYQRSFVTSLRRMSAGEELQHKSIPTPFERKMLVWTKTFPNQESIPDRIPSVTLKRAWDKFRIRVNFGMVVATAVSALAMIQYGKYLRWIGDSLSDRSMNWINGLRQQGLEEERLKNEGTNELQWDDSDGKRK